MSKEGSLANVFGNKGKVLAVMGFLKTKADKAPEKQREEFLKILSPERLGLKAGVKYRIVDISHNRYLDEKVYTLNELRRRPVELVFGRPLILLIEPEQAGPRLVYFRGVDDIAILESVDKMIFMTKTVAGSPLLLYLDEGDVEYKSLNEGITRQQSEGDFTVFGGFVPDDGVVVLGQ